MNGAAFLKELEEDLRWREQELTALKILAATSDSKSRRQTSLLRALTAMLYAHYEGFCKFCWDAYVSEISKTSTKKKHLAEKILISSLRPEINKVRHSMPDHDLVKFMSRFHGYCAMPGPLSIIIDTKSNLWPVRFQEIMDNLELKIETLNLHTIDLKALVGRRNAIAHGERLETKTLLEYERFEKSALIFMHDLAFILADALEAELFKKRRYRKKKP
jgi:hypothetical protein